jgi:hypothetical protein
LDQDRADVFLTGTVRSVSGTSSSYRITLQVFGNNYEVRTDRSTNILRSNEWSINSGLFRRGDRISVEGILEEGNRIYARSITTNSNAINGVSVITRIVHSMDSIEVIDSGGQRATVAVTRNTDIYRGRQRLDLEDLQVGDRIQIELDRDNRGRLVAERIDVVSEQNRNTLSGRVSDVESRNQLLWIRTEDQRTIRVDVGQAEIVRGGKTVRFNDIREGDTIRVSGDLSGTTLRANRIEIISNRESGPFSSEGKVSEINIRARSFSIDTRVVVPVRFRVSVSDQTEFRLNSRRASLDDLRVGDRVTVEGNLQGSSRIEATRVEIKL